MTLLAAACASFGTDEASFTATGWTTTNGLAVYITTDRSTLQPGDTLHVKVLKTNGDWNLFSADQWIGEISSLSLKSKGHGSRR